MRFENRVQELTQSTGTGSLTLYGAYPKFREFGAAFSNGDQLTYLLETEQGEWEIGIGVYDSSNNRIVRENVRITSENNQQPLDIQSGTHRVSHVVSAEAINYISDSLPDKMSDIVDDTMHLAQSTNGSFTFSQGFLTTITEAYPNGDKVTNFFYGTDGSMESIEETYGSEKRTTVFNYSAVGELIGYDVTVENV